MDLHENSQAADHDLLEGCGDKSYSPEFWERILFPDQKLKKKQKKQKKERRTNYKAYVQKGSISFSIKEDFPLDVSKEFVVSYFNKQAREFGGRIQKIVRMKCKKTI
jgi:hypothetical protein